MTVYREYIHTFYSEKWFIQDRVYGTISEGRTWCRARWLEGDGWRAYR